MNLGDNSSWTMKFGLSANFEIGDTGFHIVPGIGFTGFDEKTLEAGISFFYSF